MREIEEPSIDKYGNQVHPAFGLIGAHRGSRSEGAILFDSDIGHRNTISVRIQGASRKRSLHSDWIHGTQQYIEVEMSEAQWASFVSSMNVGDGVPCTLRFADHKIVPELPVETRLAQTMQETHDAAHEAYDNIKKAMVAYEATLSTKAPAKERAAALRALHFAIEHASANVDFAGKMLIEQSENVVTRARADIEAFVVTKARQLGVDAAELDGEQFSIGS